MSIESTRTWKGEPVYDCPACPFDSLRAEVVEDHIRKTHTAPPAPPSSIINPSTNRRFNEVVEDPSSEEPTDEFLGEPEDEERE